jgi:segregation and condensation protein A
VITVAIAAAYDGPLDVLLALVRRESYPIDRIPLGEITHLYERYLKENPIDVDLGAEFFETASWLVLLKSRALLPGMAEEPAPEQELASALLHHEALQAAATQLRERLDGVGVGPGSERERRTEAREPQPAAVSVPAVPTVNDMLLAARRALEHARAQAQGAALAPADAYPVERLYRELEERLAVLEPGRGVSTEEWFRALPDGHAQAALLLALLELARTGRVLLAQREPLAPVLLQCLG